MDTNLTGTCYGKITDVINGIHLYIKTIPCAIGRTSSRDLIPFKQRKTMIGKTIKLDLTSYFDTREVSDYDIQSKLIIENCKQICPVHFILFFDHKTNEFKIKPIGSCFHNNKQQSLEAFVVKSYDNICINCQLCKSDHVYIIDFPSIVKPEVIYHMNSNEEMMNGIGGDHEGFTGSKGKRMPDVALAAKWTNHEKDCLKKYLMTYGYGRWEVIKRNSGGVLNDKDNSEIKIFANGFLKTIIELLPSEKAELKSYLIRLIDEGPNDPYILPKPDDWGNVMKQKHPAWGKRIQLLNRVIDLIERFKEGRRKNRKLREKIDSDSTTEEEKAALSKDISKAYDNWENLLNFIPNSTLYGQKPSLFWSRFYDIDLLRGIYKYGYANYPKFFNDSKLIFSRYEKNNILYEPFPQADTITRRLKKLIQIMIKNENSNGNDAGNSSEDIQNYQEQTGFSLIEKKKILEYLINFGLPLNNEGKNDWGVLRDKLLNANCIAEDNKNVSPQKIERLLHIFLDISRTVMRKNLDSKKGNKGDNEKGDEGEEENDNEGDDNNDDNNDDDDDDDDDGEGNKLKDQLDPDGDGFIITKDQSTLLMKRMNILTFIRKYLISNSYKFFYTGLSILTEMTTEGNTLPQKCKETTWKCAFHDRTLLSLIEDQGFDIVTKLREINHQFKNPDLTPDEYIERIYFLCDFYNDLLLKDKKKKEGNLPQAHPTAEASPQSITNTNNPYSNTMNHNANIEGGGSSKKKANKLIIQRDENGNYTYPIVINPSLQIKSLGVIDYLRPAYHSERNFFPIGYTAVREHQSMMTKGNRASYTCEILDGGQKPQYKIIPEEDPDNPIIRDSSTGCWMVICNRINQLQSVKRPKVTISGTERFGLCDSNVVKLLRTLPNADQCTNYNKKQADE